MASRANCIVIRDGEVTSYAMGGGESFDVSFAVGPDIVPRWLERLDAYRSDELFDDGVCEGAVLIDFDRRHLLLFTNFGGIQDELYAHRVAVLEAYTRTWPGWTIEWAYDGVGDLARRLGRDRATVRNPETFHDVLYPDGIHAREYTTCLVTVAENDRITAYALSGDAVQPWRLGPALMDALAGLEPVTACRTMPVEGIHLDVDRWQAGVWSVRGVAGLADWWGERWPGWRLKFWADDYGRHLRACGDAVTVPPVDVAAGLRKFAKQVWNGWPVEENLRAGGVDVDTLRPINFAGIDGFLSAQVAAVELGRVVDAINRE